MIYGLNLFSFKNFRRTRLDLGPFTVLIGANASGKSNIRDAFRFIHGLSRGYTLAETVGEKWIEGGVLQWMGIRGGIRETPYFGESQFTVIVGLDDTSYGAGGLSYGIQVGSQGNQLRTDWEILFVPDDERPFFKTHDQEGTSFGSDTHHISAQVRQRGKRGADPIKSFCLIGLC